MKTVKEINEEVEKNCLGDFPFIDMHKITALKKGIYNKKNHKSYKGITATYDPIQEKTVVRLNGYYYIPEDIVIVPDKMIMTPRKNLLLLRFKTNGYKQVNNLPSNIAYYYSEDSEEYKIAIKRLEDYKEVKRLESIYNK